MTRADPMPIKALAPIAGLLVGDCRTTLARLPAKSVQCCVTSPPYWGLRDYGVEGQIGLEATVDQFVAEMVAVFREVHRVLRDDGTLWLNLGDSYASGGRGGNPTKESSTLGGTRHSQDASIVKRSIAPPAGLKPKDLIGVPWRVAFALQADGWYLRQDIIWHKPSPMPESVRDRCTKAHEYLFLLTKNERYYFDAKAIEEPASPNTNPRISRSEIERIRRERNGGAGTTEAVKARSPKAHAVDGMVKFNGSFATAVCLPTDSKNKRSVWTIASEPRPVAHFARYPQALVGPCIAAGTSAMGCCGACGAPRRRVTTTGWEPSCDCGTEAVPCTVLDPFMGSGTTAVVAERMGRRWAGCELSEEYAEIIRKRLDEEGTPLITRGDTYA